MTDELASAYADNWSGTLAVPLTALGSLRAESVLSRVPFLEKLLPKIGDYFESAAARTAMRLTVSSGEQAGIQMVQDQLPYLMQDLGSAFSQAIPGVQWSNGKDGPLDGLWTKAGQSVITMLPFSILTGIHGLQRDASSRGFAEKPSLERQAFGFAAEANAEIDAAAAQGQSSLNEAVDRALETRDPNSDTAKSALAELDAQQTTAKSQTAEQSPEDVVKIPVIRRTDEGYTVHDPQTDEIIGAASDATGAVKLAQSHLEAARFAEAQRAGEAPKLVTTDEGTIALHPDTGEPLGSPGTVEEAYRQAKGYVEAAKSRAGSDSRAGGQTGEVNAPSYNGPGSEYRRFGKLLHDSRDAIPAFLKKLGLPYEGSKIGRDAHSWILGENRLNFRDGLVSLAGERADAGKLGRNLADMLERADVAPDVSHDRQGMAEHYRAASATRRKRGDRGA